MGELKLKEKFCFYNQVRLFYVSVDGTQLLLVGV